MNRLTVISPAYYDNLSPTLYLADSCERLGLKLHLYGQGEPWPWLLEAKVVRLAKEIEKIESEYFLMTDAGDSFILSDEDTILAKFHAMGGKIVVSAEKKCWPNESLAEHYPDLQSPWRFLNSGGFVGTKSDLLVLLRAMLSVEHPQWLRYRRTRDGINDQYLMSLLYVELFPIQLDTGCAIFQCMGDAAASDFTWEHDVLRNNVTNSCPSVLHFNGHTPGIEEAYEKRFVLDAACR